MSSISSARATDSKRSEEEWALSGRREEAETEAGFLNRPVEALLKGLRNRTFDIVESVVEVLEERCEVLIEYMEGYFVMIGFVS